MSQQSVTNFRLEILSVDGLQEHQDNSDYIEKLVISAENLHMIKASQYLSPPRSGSSADHKKKFVGRTHEIILTTPNMHLGQPT
jgi:hypothetical protein